MHLMSLMLTVFRDSLYCTQVMEAGKVAEFAMPHELLNVENGRFRSLVDELGAEMKESFVSVARKRYDTQKHIYAKDREYDS